MQQMLICIYSEKHMQEYNKRRTNTQEIKDSEQNQIKGVLVQLH